MNKLEFYYMEYRELIFILNNRRQYSSIKNSLFYSNGLLGIDLIVFKNIKGFHIERQIETMEKLIYHNE